MDEQLKPKGGNPFLDQMADEDPTLLKRMWEGGAMPFEEGYKHMFGQDAPSRFGSPSLYKSAVANHAKLQGTLMEHATQYLDPTYGVTKRSLDEAMDNDLRPGGR